MQTVNGELICIIYLGCFSQHGFFLCLDEEDGILLSPVVLDCKKHTLSYTHSQVNSMLKSLRLWAGASGWRAVPHVVILLLFLCRCTPSRKESAEAPNVRASHIMSTGWVGEGNSHLLSGLPPAVVLWASHNGPALLDAVIFSCFWHTSAPKLFPCHK